MEEKSKTESDFFTNSLGMTFRHVRVASSPKGYLGSDKPLRNVGVVQSDFAIAIHLVTQQEYCSLVGENPSYFQGEQVGNRDTTRCPVEYVSCAQAVKFCRILSQFPAERRLRRHYRLPTEAEWEYAYLAREGFAPEASNAPEVFGEYAWIEQNSNNRTHSVGQKQPNPWGIFDMSGNVWEWCLDTHVSEITENTDLTIEPSPNFECSFRGGDFGCGVEFCGLANIHRVNSYYRGNFVGFRLVLELD